MTVPTPVSLVTGFLGAGKTTLLNHLLQQPGGPTFGVVENEFGSDGIDSELLAARAEAVFELTEGCACCEVREDLVELFETLPDFEHVLLEASGLAEPGPIMQVFEQPSLRSRYRLDAVITVVDVEHIEGDLAEPTAVAQLTYADVLVLNKADRVSEDVLEGVAARLRALNPLARQVRATFSAVAPDELFAARAVDELMDCVAAQKGREPHGHEHDHDHAHDHDHDQSIVSVSVEAAGAIDVRALDRWLGALVRREDATLLRMKGILAVPGRDQRFVFHGVRDVIDVRPDRPWLDKETRGNRAVFIGRGLDADELQRGFVRCALGTEEFSP